MKVKQGFILREIAEQWIVFPLNTKVIDFNQVITLSKSGALLWNKLGVECEKEDLVKEIISTYTIDEETAAKDVDEFIEIIRENNLLD